VEIKKERGDKEREGRQRKRGEIKKEKGDKEREGG